MKIKVAVVFGLFVATVYAANWALNNFGDDNHNVAIGFGLMAPAGVYFAGLGFGLRDALHELGGRGWVLAAITTGAALSYLIESSVVIPGGVVPIAVASGGAFLLSELADLAIYSPLRERQWVGAVVASNIVGAIVDSVFFLWLAFGNADAWFDLTIGKAYMIAPAVVLVGLIRRGR